MSNLNVPSSSLNSLLSLPMEMENSGSLPGYTVLQSLTQAMVAIRRAPSTGQILSWLSLIYHSQMQNLFQQKPAIWTNK